MLLKAPENEEELRKFLKRLEIEIEIKRRKRILKKFINYLRRIASEFEIDLSTLEILIEKKINTIKYTDINIVINNLNNYMPGVALLLKRKVKEWECE